MKKRILSLALAGAIMLALTISALFICNFQTASNFLFGNGTEMMTEPSATPSVASDATPSVEPSINPNVEPSKANFVSSPKDDYEIARELIQVDSAILKYDMRVTGQTVNKRQTNEEQKNDHIWITVFAECNEFSYAANYTVEYVLYNEGWLLENYECTDYDYFGNSSLFQQEEPLIISKGYLKEHYNYFQYQGEVVDDENKTVNMQFRALNRDGFVDYALEIEILCTFNPRQEPAWKIENVVTSSETQDWRRLLGKYESHDFHGTRILYILDFSLEDGELASLLLRFSGDIDQVSGMPRISESGTYKTWSPSSGHWMSVPLETGGLYITFYAYGAFSVKWCDETYMKMTKPQDQPDFLDEFFSSESEIECGISI